MSKIKNPLNYNHNDYPGQKFTQPSMTVPDQTMSIKTIMDRYAKGLPIADGFTPIYEDDDIPSSGINPRTLDLVDLQELRIENKEKIQYLEEKIKSSKKQPKNSEVTVNGDTSTNNP